MTITESLQPWTPDQPLRHNATNEEIAARFNMIRGNSESPLVYFNEHLGAVAREYAAACVAPAPAPHEDTVRLLREAAAFLQASKDNPYAKEHAAKLATIADLLAQPPVRSEEEPVAWQRCPICEGRGVVAYPPGVTATQPSFASSSTSPYPCPLCNGRMIVLPALPQEGPTAQQVWRWLGEQKSAAVTGERFSDAADLRGAQCVIERALGIFTGVQPVEPHADAVLAVQAGPTRAEVEALDSFGDEGGLWSKSTPETVSRGWPVGKYLKRDDVLALFPKVGA